MRTRRQLVSGFTALSAILAAGPRRAQAAGQILRFASISDAETNSYTQLLDPFARAVERDSNGRIDMALKPAGGYGKPTGVFPMVENGEIELGSTLQGYHPGRFPQTSVIELPMLYDNAATGTAVLTTLYKEGLLAKDYASVKVLALYVAPPFGIFTTGKTLNTVKDLRGLRVRTPGATVGLALARLGAIPLGIPAPMVGDAIANGTIEAMAISMDTALNTKGAGGRYLAEQLSVVVDLRFAAPAQMVVMNRASWDALPPDLQAILEQDALAAIGNGLRLRQAAETAAWQHLQADSRYTCISFGDAQRLEMQHALAPVFDDWQAGMSKLGIDGERLLARTRELIRQSPAGPH